MNANETKPAVLPAGTSNPSDRNRSGWAMGSSTLCSNSSRISANAPTSLHVTSGTTAKPSRLADGWTDLAAMTKSIMCTAGDDNDHNNDDDDDDDDDDAVVPLVDVVFPPPLDSAAV